MKIIKIPTTKKREILDIGCYVEEILAGKTGLVHLFLKHTTAALTTANLDRGTDQDFLNFLQSATPPLKWKHAHNPKHAPDHLWASLIGTSVTLPVKSGRLALGNWQSLVLIELDGGRDREICISFTEDEGNALALGHF